MTRDYSQFLPPETTGGPHHRPASPLETLGWQPFFAQQIGLDELARTPPARIVEVHRNALHIIGDALDTTIPPLPDVTVGDWILFDEAHPQSSRVLERKSLIKRRAPGTDR